MPRAYHRIKQPYPCPQCGLVVLNHRKPSHAESVYHRHAPRVRMMLEDASLNFAEIGRLLGVTREYVRQIAVRIGAPPLRKRKSWSPERRQAQALERNTLLQEVLKEAESHGLAARLVPVKTGSGIYRIRMIRIGPYRCVIRRLVAGYRDLFILNCPARPDADYLLAKSPYGWMVIPVRELPQGGSTGFILGRQRRTPGTRRHRHDWPSYLNAWDLLRGRKKAPSKQAGPPK